MEEEMQVTAVELLAQNEEKVSQLYKAYADKFSNWNKFWLSLSLSEIEHAKWIRDLYSAHLDKTVYLNEDRFKIEPIQIFAEYLQQQLAQVKEQEMPIKSALAIALEVENALIENRYFEVLQADSVEIKRTLLDLAAATADHKNVIKELLAKL